MLGAQNKLYLHSFFLYFTTTIFHHLNSRCLFLSFVHLTAKKTEFLCPVTHFVLTLTGTVFFFYDLAVLLYTNHHSHVWPRGSLRLHRHRLCAVTTATVQNPCDPHYASMTVQH